ncbi:MAG: glycosyl transferase [Butyrivibrio sp.]|nr:glycosyl transferase [Butyrivibrio sp.]
MIFVTVGTQKFQMNRLMKQVEELAVERPNERIVVQYGHSTYVPKNCECYQFMDRPQFEECIDKCDILLTHGGVGTIMAGLRHGKQVIVVPRLRQYGEHVDDHQIEAAQALKHHNCLAICMNIEFLTYMVEHISSYVFSKYEEPEKKVEDLVLECIESPKPLEEKNLSNGFFKIFSRKNTVADTVKQM